MWVVCHRTYNCRSVSTPWISSVEICLAGSSGTSASIPKIFRGLSSTKYSGEEVARHVPSFIPCGKLRFTQKLATFVAEPESVSRGKVLCRQALSETEILFSTPDWEVWQQHLVLGKTKHTFSSQLVGKDRQIILWANAVLPFFLEYARRENEPELKKLLYRLFMIIPAEASYSKTRFMEIRLWFSELPKSCKLKLNSFENRQGLIQIKHDFAATFIKVV